MSGVNYMVKLYCVCIIVVTAVSIYNMSNSKDERPSSFNCVLPPEPPFGRLSLLFKLTKSSGLPTGTILQISCNETYKLDGSNMTICIRGRWFPAIGRCLKTCPSMFSTSMIKVRCSYGSRKMKNCEESVDNTQAHFTCAPFYEDERRIKMDAICNNGKWSEKMPECIPVCGRRKSKKVRPLIVNGTVTDRGEFPWQVAIYRNKTYICGGTLLHEKLILTAAHCLSDSDGTPEPAENYRVAVGTHCRKYGHQEDKNHQSSSIHAIFLPENYAGMARMYYGDIALIVPDKTFQLSETVLPICIDWNEEYEYSLFRSNKSTAHVSGWGYTTEYRHFSENLRSLEVPLIPREKCLAMTSDYHEFITEDKICAGYLNKSTSVCHGDSGSGLVFHHNGRYYIIGIVSIAPRGNTPNGGCNSHFFGFYTHVSKYIADFIWEFYARFKPSRSQLMESKSTTEDYNFQNIISAPVPNRAILKTTTGTDCLLPQHPNFGQWSLFGNITSNLAPEMLVKTGAILKTKCEKGYRLDGDKMIVCEDGTWSSGVGKCLKTCPSIESTETMNVTCFHKMGQLENCIEPIDGTTAKHQCAPFYEDMKLMEHPLFCTNGTWSPVKPECRPKCGEKLVEDPLYEKNNSLKEDYYPWIVGIYRKIDLSLICIGSLLTEKVVLTAANCLANQDNETLVDDYIIAAGKVNSDFENAQFLDIERVHLQKNIAFVVVKTSFHLSFTVRPVCVDWERKFKTKNLEGYVSGWSHKKDGEWKTIKADLVPIENCATQSQTDEKICVRYHLNHTSSCLVDRGGGLFVKLENKYYVVGGMTDVLKTKENCHFHEYNLFTPVYDYTDTMLSEVFLDQLEES